MDNVEFRFLKKIDTILTIRESGLIEHLEDQVMPDVIILFGSASKGEDLIGSDIDLFLLCRERKLDLTFFENKIKKKISLLFSKDFNLNFDDFSNYVLEF